MTSVEVLNLIRDTSTLPVSSSAPGNTNTITRSTVREDDVKLDIVSTASPLRKSGSLKLEKDKDKLRKSTESMKSSGGADNLRKSTESVLSKKSSFCGGRSPTLDPLLGTVDECLAHAICVEQPDSDGDDD